MQATLSAELASPGSDDVIAWRGTARRSSASPARSATARCGTAVRPDGADILTGALGGLGLVASCWLVERGAGRTALNGSEWTFGAGARRAPG